MTGRLKMDVLVDMRDGRERTAYAIARDLRMPLFLVHRAVKRLGRDGLMTPAGEIIFNDISVDRTWRITAAGMTASGDPISDEA